MKIAIIIAGFIRSFKNNLTHLKNNLIQNNEVDIYIHKNNNENIDRYYNNNDDWDYIVNNIKPKIIIKSEDISFHNDKRFNNLLNQFYKFYILNDIKNIIMKEESITYDLVIKWRPDILLNKKIDFTNIQEDIIYIPNESKIDINKLNHFNDKYLCDIIAYGSNNIMNYYFNFFKNLKSLIHKYGYCQETLLYHYLQNKNYKEVSIDYSVILSTCNIISISGNSGSGKTLLSNFLQKDISNSFILECDRYHKWERGNINWKQFTHLNPNANYITKMRKDIFDLKIGKNIFQVDYDHKTGKFTQKNIIESKDTVIVCGLHSLYNSNSNINIFIDTMDELNKFWKIKRDTKKRGYSIEKVLKSISDRDADFKKYVLPQKNEADIIINFYTDDKIVFDDLQKNYDIKLNLFIKKKYNILNLLTFFQKDINNIIEDNKYYKLNFMYKDNYYEIIKHIIKNIIL